MGGDHVAGRKNGERCAQFRGNATIDGIPDFGVAFSMFNRAIARGDLTYLIYALLHEA
jgi:hypothetical protein